MPDEDIKIYSNIQEPSAAVSEDEEQSATEYLLNKQNGNIEKSKIVGEALAAEIVGISRSFVRDSYYKQKLVLLSYIVETMLERNIDNQLLGKTALASMTKWISENSTEVARAIHDSRAFTMYNLNEISRTPKSAGEVMADICNEPENIMLISTGNNLDAQYRMIFSDIIENANFV